jgi:hypothetical protein
MILDTDYPIPCPKCRKVTFEYDYVKGRRECVNPLCNYIEGKQEDMTTMKRFWTWLLEE